MKKTVLMSALIVLCLCACSDDEESVILIDEIPTDSKVNYLHYFTDQEFERNTANIVYTFSEYYYLSNNEPITRATQPIHIRYDAGNKFDYCPSSFWFENGELFCSVRMDSETFRQWHEYSQKHNIELYVHSPFTYDEKSGTLKTNNKIIPGEEINCVYHIADSDYYLYNCRLLVELNESLTGSYGNEKYKYMYTYYNRSFRDNKFNMEMKVFDTNEEAIAYAKELMAQ